MSEGITARARIAAPDLETAALDEPAAAIPLDERAEEPLAKRRARSAKHKDSTGEVIEPGRALALTDFTPPATSAGEKLIRLAYRLGVSGTTLTAPFRKPIKPRVLATVETPLIGERVAGIALRAGHFLVYGVKAPILQMDFSSVARLTPPFERAVHGFEWLRLVRAPIREDQRTSIPGLYVYLQRR